MKMRMLGSSLLAFSFAAIGCAVDTTDVDSADQSIISGTPVDDAGWPTVVGLATNMGSICTGTLISPTAVLTAAHCVEPELMKQAAQAGGIEMPEEIVYKITYINDMRAAQTTDFLDVASVEWHEDFGFGFPELMGPGKANDIAIVHLAQPVMGRPVQLVADAEVASTLAAGEGHAVVGYGMTINNDANSAGYLSAGVSGLDQVTPFELSAGDGDPQQGCKGDSGGPIFIDGSDSFQIGIASRMSIMGALGGGCGSGLMYTRVDAYIDWIKARVTDLGQMPAPLPVN